MSEVLQRALKVAVSEAVCLEQWEDYWSRRRIRAKETIGPARSTTEFDKLCDVLKGFSFTNHGRIVEVEKGKSELVKDRLRGVGLEDNFDIVDQFSGPLKFSVTKL